MSRKGLLVLMLAMSIGAFGQRSGGSGTTGSGSSGSGTPGSGTTAGSGINTPASQAGAPTTQGAVGGASGQAAAGPITTPSANTAGSPTLPAAMAGPAGTTGTTQANPANLNNGTTLNNGFVGTVAVGSGVLSTPGGTFASPAPTAGISDAGRAGISANAPVNTGVQSSLENSTVVYTNGAPVNPSEMNVSASAGTPGRLINDLAPSFYSDTIAGNGNRVSVAEVAAQFKASRAAANARMLTNEDVQKMMSSKTGVTMAKNMPPLGPGAAPQTSAAQSGGQAPSNAQAAPANSSAAQQSQTGSAEQRAGTPPPATSQGQTTGSEATAGNETTPQINQNQQSNDAQGRSKLPATSTLLPLFGLLGIVSGGLGLWFRKWRR